MSAANVLGILNVWLCGIFIGCLLQRRVVERSVEQRSGMNDNVLRLVIDLRALLWSLGRLADIAASGMEARSDATPQSGAAEGDSPTGNAGDAQGPSA